MHFSRHRDFLPIHLDAFADFCDLNLNLLVNRMHFVLRIFNFVYGEIYTVLTGTDSTEKIKLSNRCKLDLPKIHFRACSLQHNKTLNFLKVHI